MSERANRIIRDSGVGSLGTIGAEGNPFVSLVTLSALTPTRLVMLLSGIAQHTKDLSSRPCCSLMLVDPASEPGDPLAGARLTVTGLVTKLDDDTEARAAFLTQHRSAAMYADFEDFAFYQLDVTDAYLVAGFGRIESIPASRLGAPSEIEPT